MMEDLYHEVQGTTLEGGGQLVRLAIGLSALSGVPVRISDIRGRRPKGGGLKIQHLTSINWLIMASCAKVVGAENKSRTLEFWPMEKRKRPPATKNSFQIKMSTPGAITLVFQAILPFILFSGTWTEPVRVTINGGTNVSFSPSYEYVDQVLLPTLARIGLPPIAMKLEHRGWSTGRTELGSVTFTITPLAAGNALPAFTMRDRGDIKHVRATVLAPSTCRTIFSNEIAKALQDMPLAINFEDSSHPKRLYLILVAESSNGYLFGRDLLFERKITSYEDAVAQIVKRVAEALLLEIATGGCVDEYMEDELVVFQALAKGRSVVEAGEDREPSLHTQTARWIVGEVLGANFDEDGSCDGVGLAADAIFRKPEGMKDGEAEGEVIADFEGLSI